MGATCIRCEVLRARTLANVMALAMSKEAIANKLTSMIGANHFVDKGVIWRSTHYGNYRIYGSQEQLL